VNGEGDDSENEEDVDKLKENVQRLDVVDSS